MGVQRKNPDQDSNKKYIRQCANTKRAKFAYVDSCWDTAHLKGGRKQSFDYRDTSTHGAEHCVQKQNARAVGGVVVHTNLSRVPELKKYDELYGICTLHGMSK